MIQERRGRNKIEARQLDIEQQENKFRAQERAAVAARDSKMVELYSNFIVQQKDMTDKTTKLTVAIESLAGYEQQNHDLLERVIGSQSDTTTSLATITGAMDAAVASLGRIEAAITSGNGDHLTIAKTLVRVTAALGRIEAKLTPPPTKPDIAPGAHDDEQERKIA